MTHKFLSVDEVRTAARSGTSLGGGAVQKLSTEPTMVVAGAKPTVTFCVSEEIVDRAGDIMFQNWTNLPEFEQKNGICLWNHDSSQLPIGRWKNMRVVGKRTLGDLEFASEDVYPFAQTVYALIKNNFLNACSVGVIPKKFSFSKDPSRPNGIDFLLNELLEVSVVALPACQTALVTARSMGINSDHIRRIQHELGERESRIIRARKIAAAATRALALGQG